MAWRMAATNGVDFTNSMRGGRWGNANNWDENAVALGYAVNGTPARGAIAQTNAGSFGHVAWVESVNGDGTVTVEDYNFAGTGAYARRVVPASTYQYIHVQDISPPPPPPPPPVDLSVRVRNGSFESGFTHWTGRQGSGNTNFVAYTDARRAHDGSRFGATNTAGGGSIYNDSAVTMNAGDSIAVGAWVRAQSGTARGRLCAWGLGSTSNESICRTYRVSTTYKYVQLVLNPRGAHNTLRVELYPTNNAGTTFIDTVSMRQN
ncbi:MAG: CHAP domain-containing protein [Acidimicrobiales bacterium]|nr:CHAP domain-containing protein [Acidimicrobiales bacterium]